MESQVGVETSGQPGPPTPRSGRNMPVASAVGLGLLGLVAGSLFWRHEVFVLLVVLAVGGAVWELSQAFARRGLHLPLPPLLVGTVGILVSAYTAGEEALLVSFMLTAGGVVVWRVLDDNEPAAFKDVVAGCFAAAYLPFLAGFVILMLDMPDGPARAFLFVLLVVASDVGGLAAGVMFGRHPLAPSVSPKKTWEGLAGSVVLACAIGAVGWVVAFDQPALTGMLLGLVAVVAATLGDLAESLLKRDLALKDMGSLLPGHGGLLDRLDSIVMAAPVVYLVMLVTLPVGD